MCNCGSWWRSPQETDAFGPGGGQRSLQVDNASVSVKLHMMLGKAGTDGNPPEPTGTHENKLESMSFSSPSISLISMTWRSWCPLPLSCTHVPSSTCSYNTVGLPCIAPITQSYSCLLPCLCPLLDSEPWWWGLLQSSSSWYYPLLLAQYLTE